MILLFRANIFVHLYHGLLVYQYDKQDDFIDMTIIVKDDKGISLINRINQFYY